MAVRAIAPLSNVHIIVMIIQTPVRTSATQDADAVPIAHREFTKKQSHKFFVHLSFDRGDDSETVDYELKAATFLPADSQDRATLDLTFERLVLRLANHVIRKPSIGAGKIDISSTGLPYDLNSAISDTHFWYPLLSFYLPGEVDKGAFKVEESLGDSTTLHGKGTVQGNAYEMDGTILQGASMFAKYKITWKLDPKGWVAKAKGEVTDPQGTLEFSISQ
jgi:hypothetical protein